MGTHRAPNLKNKHLSLFSRPSSSFLILKLPYPPLYTILPLSPSGESQEHLGLLEPPHLERHHRQFLPPPSTRPGPEKSPPLSLSVSVCELCFCLGLTVSLSVCLCLSAPLPPPSSVRSLFPLAFLPMGDSPTLDRDWRLLRGR